MKITLENSVTVSPDVLFQEIGGEAVLLNRNSESYFGLNAVGTRAWQLIQQTSDLRIVHASLLAEYDVAPAQLEQDMSQLIGQLADAGLVKVDATAAEDD